MHYIVAVLATATFTVTPARADDPTGSPQARIALAACHHAATLDGQAQAALLAEAASQAAAAISAAPDDPVAHFAAFCARGRRLEARGLSFGAVLDLRPARQALDTALRLLPDYPDALAAKGAMLLRLPRLLGGDAELGAHLLHRAAALAPDNAATQHLLTQLVPATTPAAVAGHERCE